MWALEFDVFNLTLFSLYHQIWWWWYPTNSIGSRGELCKIGAGAEIAIWRWSSWKLRKKSRVRKWAKRGASSNARMFTWPQMHYTYYIKHHQPSNVICDICDVVFCAWIFRFSIGIGGDALVFRMETLDLGIKVVLQSTVCRHVGPFRGDCNHHVLHTCIGHRSYRELWWASEAGGGQDDSFLISNGHGAYGIVAHSTWRNALGKLRSL